MKKLVLTLGVCGLLFACGNEPAVSGSEAEAQDQVDSAQQEDMFDQLEDEIKAEEGGINDGTEVMPNDAEPAK